MYNDLFTIGKITIHSYGLCTGLALLAALWMSCVRARKKGLNDDICYGILFVGVIFGYLASKTTFVLVEFKSFIADPKAFLSSSGFVVMGGLIGGVIAAWVYCRIKKVDFMDYFDVCAPAIAIAQCIGRIGCFMAGCCYGRQTDSPIGIAFTHSNYAPNNVKLIPTQLISSALDLVNCIVLILIAKKTKKKGTVGALYVIFYSIGRFFIEYLRDDNRGNIGIFSTSQAGSIVTLVIGVLMLLLIGKFGKPVEVVAKESAPESEASEKEEE